MKIHEAVCAIGAGYILPATVTAMITPVIQQIGRVILPLARTGLLHAGIIGAIQYLAGTSLYFLAFYNKKDSTALQTVKYLGAQAIAGAVLIGISVLAIKAGLIVSTTTLTGLVILALASSAISLESLTLSLLAFQIAKEKGWIEITKEPDHT